jgi:predicted DNA-binding transcriptional regulator AlpA
MQSLLALQVDRKALQALQSTFVSAPHHVGASQNNTRALVMPRTDEANGLSHASAGARIETKACSLHRAAPAKPSKNQAQGRSPGSWLPEPPSHCSVAALAGENWSQGDQRLVRTGEAAAYLGLSASYLNKLRVQGCGPVFIKLSRAVRYRQADLEAWLSSRQHSSTSAAQLALEAEAREGRD